MSHRLAPQAEADLLEIWSFVAQESENPEVADKFIDVIAERILLLAKNPHLGRPRDHDLQVGLRSFAIGNYVIFYYIEGKDVLILRLLHGRRDIPSLLND